jgi:damage-control phosphatase, subfamily I
MKTYYDCIECFARQALDAARLLSADENIHEQVLRKVLSESSEMDFYKSPPAMGQRIHRLIRELLGDDDPYRQIKDRSNLLAMKLYPELKKNIEQSSDPLKTALRFAIAGNIIDLGVNSKLDESVIYKTLEDSAKNDLFPDTIDDFRNAIDHATDILYLGDNAGEIVFDRLLIKQLPYEKVTFVVRGSPVINDATLVDAQLTGMTDIVEVIDNGSDAPGTILEDCSEAFRHRFKKADLIIAKGQGNYESLSYVEKNIIFALLAKCQMIARDIGCDVGSFVLKKWNPCSKFSEEK